MKHYLALLAGVLLLTGPAGAQADSNAIRDIRHFQAELNQEYRTPGKSPLTPRQLKAFSGHVFFPVDLSYRVAARLVRTEQAIPFRMPTTGAQRPLYQKYGEVHFTLQGQEYRLNVYQSLDLTRKAGFEDYLFLPFTDQTNGHSTYGGGRYLDLRIPTGDTLVLDFNKAYNPYCAYANGYSCPVPPRENRLPIAIPAGVRMADDE